MKLTRHLMIAVVAFVLLFSDRVNAQAYGNRVRFESRGILLSTTCNSTLTTSWAFTEGFSQLTLSWALTDANASASAVTATCVGTGDQETSASSTYDIPVVVSTAAGGTVTYVKYTYSYATSGTTSSQFTIGVAGDKHVRCTFVCGGSGSDTLTVRGSVTTP